MPESLILYVKSEKFEQVQWTMPHHDHYCSAGYRAQKADFVLSENDQKAIDVVKETGLEYTLVDLGLAGGATRLKAKTDGIKTTPTLIYRGQKLEGLLQVMEMLKTIVDIQQK
jgi:hypothetical protein